MDASEFVKRINSSIEKNQIDPELLRDENRFLRSKYIFKTINSFSKIIELLDYKNDIIFEDNIPFVQFENVKLMVCDPYFLKSTNKKIDSHFKTTYQFLSKLNIKPNFIVDLGACWGACSIYLASKFKNAKIYSIEGSEKNFEIFKKNIIYNSNLNSEIHPLNLIISDKDGFHNITDNLSTMNMLETIHNKKIPKSEFKKVKAISLSTLVKTYKIPKIDFLKIDIEGSELNLIEDLLLIDIEAMQLELINYNSIKDNIEFLSQLNKKFKFYDPITSKKIQFNELKSKVINNFKNNPTIDLFLHNLTKNEI